MSFRRKGTISARLYEEPMAEVLDTAALLFWPVERIAQGICAESQMQELRRLSEPRYLLVEANPPELMNADDVALEAAREAASRTGDLNGLSPVDIEVLALALHLQAVLHSDDYRLQNIARNEGLEVKSVKTKGIEKVWKWQLRCTGCRAVTDVESKSDEIPDCQICGSPQQLKRA